MTRSGRSIPLPGSAPLRGGPAFTLLELILVLIIVAALMSIAAPSLQRFYASRTVEDAAEHFMVLCQQARVRAVDEARTYRVWVDLSEREYWLTREADGGYQRLASELGQTFEWDQRIEVTWSGGGRSGDSAWLTFHPDGRTEPVAVLFEGRHPRNRVAVVAPSISQPLRIERLTEDELVRRPTPNR